MSRSDGDLPTVSVIVPVFNGLEALKTCVAAVLDQDYPADRFELIVADNGSATWPAPHLPDDERLRVISEPAPGSYSARNAALLLATGEVVAFTDADCRPAPDWLRTAVEALDTQPPADMVGGAIEMYFATGRPRNGAEWHEYLHGFPQQEYLAHGFAVTANLVTRRSVLDRVGPFDASLASGGDAEWCRRIRDYGGVQRYAPSSKVAHPARSTTAELTTKSRRTTEGVATKALRRPGGRRKVWRMLLGQLRMALTLPVTVWRQPAPDTAAAKTAYLATSWANCTAISGELVRALRRRDPGA